MALRMQSVELNPSSVVLGCVVLSSTLTWLTRHVPKGRPKVWEPPPGIPVEVKSQSVASFAFDEKVQAYLVSVAPNDREAQRLRRCAQPDGREFSHRRSVPRSACF